ncbi:MAG: ABC transporter ATP-binding protein [Clostridia bacterium]|nr:ABC transporter ATP-binding protein [Clostridia bacterium]
MNDIVFKDVYKSYGNVEVIKGFNLTIPEGERVILLGPSGCGKSTILRMIAGLENITAGDLYMNGKRMNDVDPGDRNVAMVFQNYALYPHMTVERNIQFGMEIAKLPKQERNERTEWALEVLGLTEYKRRYPKELSGGQRQRVALCRALVKKAPYFLLDEPLSNLDAQLRTSARAELVRVHQVYLPTFIYVTHDQVEAMTVGQRIVVLDKSVIQQQGTPDEIYNKPKNVFVARFIGSPSMNVAQADVQAGMLVTASTAVKIPDRWMNIIGDRKKVKFGIRPEHMALGREKGDYPIKITYIENHGNRSCIALNVGENAMMATTDPGFESAENMWLTLNWQKMHFFDFETDQNLGYPE